MKKTQKKSESILNYFTKLDGGKNKATLSDSTNHLNISTLRKRKTSGHLSQPSKKSKAANSIKSRSDDTKNSTGGSYSKSSTSSGSFPMSSTSSGSYSMSNTTSGSYSMSPIDNSGQTYSMKNMCNTSRTTTFHMTTDNISLYTDENRYRSSSPAGSVSSQNSISSASRYDKKGVLVEVSGTRQGVPFSSQKSILSQDKYNPPSVEKKEVMKTKNEITTSYQWMGNTDVQPFSSNYSPYKNTSQLESIHPSGGNRSWATPVTTLTNKNFSTWDSSHSVNRPPRSLPTKTGMPVGVYGGRPSGGYGGKTSGRPVGRPPGRPPGRSGTGSSFASAETPFATKKNTNYRPELSSEQKKVLKMVVDEEVSLFFTGSAGTGKSVLLRAIIDELRTKFGAQLAVTASTGIAACNINGSTLHRYTKKNRVLCALGDVDF
ncbi:hypothetical protein BDB01DRAFT_809263 [Pilobolus umbonatus]|nr:hypothetical protein BDB01DRAFT_809263 [Pilobolus umbonatus]